MKAILVPVEPDDLTQATLRTAWLLGNAFGSYIEGFALRQVPSPFVAPDSISGTIVYSGDDIHDAEAMQEARRTFETAMADFSRAVPDTGVTSGWLNDASHGDSFVAVHGRVFDVTVLGRPGASARSPRMGTLEAALFDSGRPVLVAPPESPASLGEVVAVAWNRSAETARTIALALPLMRRARRIVILSMEGGRIAGPTGEELARYLERNGMASEVLAIERSGSKSIGVAILEKSAELGSDLLIKGAFTQSRISQMIFGGATRDILAQAALPVFIAH